MGSEKEEHIRQLLTEYEEKQQLYNDFGKLVEALLTELLNLRNKTVHLIGSREKSTESFVRKVTRKAYSSLEEITDLAGVRCIVYFRDDIDGVLDIIRDEFTIDYLNSEDLRKYSDPTTFGYRSFHYIVSLSDKQLEKTDRLRFKGLKAEIQVRSILDHAWAQIQHDGLGYHAEGGVPLGTQRELAQAAALLEVADECFVRARLTATQPLNLPRVRAEGLAELIPPFEFDVDVAELHRSLQDRQIDLKLYTNVNITSRIVSSSDVSEVRLSASVPGYREIKGMQVGVNQILFSDALPEVIRSDQRYVTFTISDLRVNANQLGLSSFAPIHKSVVNALLASSKPNCEIDDTKPLCQKMIAQSDLGFQILFPRVSAVLYKDSGSLKPLLVLGFAEGFRGAIKSRREESQSPYSRADSGTQVYFDVAGLVPGLSYYIDPWTLEGNAHLVGYREFDGDESHVDLPFVVGWDSQNRQVSRLPVDPGGATRIVFEIAESDQRRTSVFLRRDTNEGRGTICIFAAESKAFQGVAKVSGGLHPISYLFTASTTAPIPRFVDNPQGATVLIQEAV